MKCDYIEELQVLQDTFAAFNKHYFGGTLEPVVITIQSDMKAYGHFTVGKLWKAGEGENVREYHEINLSAETLRRHYYSTCATLMHEMVHLLCHQNNIADTSRQGRYHNKEFKRIAEEKGLMDVATLLADNSLYAIPSTYDAFELFCALSMPTDKEVTQDTYGYGAEVLSTGSIDWLKEAQLTQVRIKKSDDVVNPLRPFELLNAKIRTNDTDIESVLDSFDVSVTADTSNASGISDLTGTGVYKFGAQVTVSFTAQSDAIVNATLNGKIIHFSKNDNTYSYTFKAGLVNNLVILTAVPNKVEGTISVTGGSYTAQEIKDGIQSVSLIAENGQVYRGTVTIDGDVVKYSVSAPDGTYTLNITTVKGFESVQSIQLTDDTSKDVSLTEIEWNNVRTIDLPDLRVETDTPTAEYIASNAVSGVGDQYMIGGNFGVNLLNAAGSSGEFMIDIGLIYDNGENVHIHFTKWSVNYYFGIKDDHNKNCGQLNLTTSTDPTDYMQLYGEKGGYVFVTVSGTQVTIYLYDGSKVNQIASGTVDTISGAKLVGVGIRKNNTTKPETVVTFTDAKIRIGDLDLDSFVKSFDLA